MADGRHKGVSVPSSPNVSSLEPPPSCTEDSADGVNSITCPVDGCTESWVDRRKALSHLNLHENLRRFAGDLQDHGFRICADCGACTDHTGATDAHKCKRGRSKRVKKKAGSRRQRKSTPALEPSLRICKYCMSIYCQGRQMLVPEALGC